MNGAAMKIMNNKVYGLIKMASKIGQDYYPEIMGQMFIVNTPMLFTGVWAVVKGFLDEKTRNKIKICGHKYQKDIFEVVAPENLPDFLGGSCTCEDRGGCMVSQRGPWEDYEIVKPVGIRKKNDTGAPAEITDGINKLNFEEKKEEEPLAKTAKEPV